VYSWLVVSRTNFVFFHSLFAESEWFLGHLKRILDMPRVRWRPTRRKRLFSVLSSGGPPLLKAARGPIGLHMSKSGSGCYACIWYCEYRFMLTELFHFCDCIRPCNAIWCLLDQLQNSAWTVDIVTSARGHVLVITTQNIHFYPSLWHFWKGQAFWRETIVQTLAVICIPVIWWI